MIDPDNITDYNRGPGALRELLLFCIFVAGHNAHTTAKNLDRFVQRHLKGWVRPSACRGRGRFGAALADYVAKHSNEQIAQHLKACGIGCYTRHAGSIRQVATTTLDLKTASVEELEKLSGVGPKTSRFFVLHSRADVNDIAVLDVHVLRFMGERGFDVPKVTPSGRRYRELEKAFVQIAKAEGKSVAGFDLEIWRERRQAAQASAAS